VEIPLHDAVAPFSTARRRACAATQHRDAAGEGDVWDTRKFPDGEWYGNFKPYLLARREERGLCFFADNDRGWVLDVNEQQPAQSAPCLALRRDKGVLTLRLNLVQKPIVIAEARKIVSA